MLVDRNSLWFRVLLARYGVEGGQLLDGGRNASLGGGLCLLFVGRSG